MITYDFPRAHHWHRISLDLEDQRFRVFESYGGWHGFRVDCGESDCNECNIWRTIIPMVDLELRSGLSPIGEVLLQASL